MATVPAHDMCRELAQAGAETCLQSCNCAVEAILPVQGQVTSSQSAPNLLGAVKATHRGR
eukprot:3499295-Rhodomonas_salina.1